MFVFFALTKLDRSKFALRNYVILDRSKHVRKMFFIALTKLDRSKFVLRNYVILDRSKHV